ncbi:hypothetical protein BH09VER1_BH09VER1_13530 [soil metagenome]
MKNFLIKSVIALCATVLATSSFAAKGNKKAAGYRGKVTAVADGTVTVSNKKLGDKTYKTDASTKVLKIDGTTGTVADLKTGSLVRVVTGTDADVATEIRAIEKKKKANAPAAPAATPAASASPAAATS